MLLAVQIGLRGDYLVVGGGLDGQYRAVMVEFHWGLDDVSGSEHIVNGLPSTLEVSLFSVIILLIDNT
jgi:hypothetical protein